MTDVITVKEHKRKLLPKRLIRFYCETGDHYVSEMHRPNREPKVCQQHKQERIRERNRINKQRQREREKQRS